MAGQLPKEVMLEGELMVVRSAAPDEMGLVFSTWMNAAREQRATSRPVYDKFYPDLVRVLMEQEPIAVLSKEGGQAIHAWACGMAPNTLHFAYVPYALRRHGFGRAVISGVLDGYPQTIYVTSSPITHENHHRFKYNPFLLMKGL